jgi:hypothetical protein
MKPEIKNYYAHHFGVFDPLTLNDIVEIGEYELNLIILPDVYYKKIKTVFRDEYANKHRDMQACLQPVLELIKN